MTASLENNWDRERVSKILEEKMEKYLSHDGGLPEAIESIVVLLSSARAEAVGWTWSEACSQYSKGLDPRRFNVPMLVLKANADLNPPRD